MLAVCLVPGIIVNNPMDPLLERLGTIVRRLRVQQGMAISDLAQRSGLSIRFVTEIIAGRGNVSLLRLESLARALGTTAGHLVLEAENGGEQTPRLVALLGVRGAGKSAIGAKLAKRLGTELFELDRLVEIEAGMPLGEIFAIHGEGYFRRLEVSVLRGLIAKGESAVLATGGGIVESPEAWELLERHTITVWLSASTEAHWTRVMKQGDPRPMAGRPAAKAELRRLLARRRPLYRRARYTIDTQRLGIAGSVRAIAERLEE